MSRYRKWSEEDRKRLKELYEKGHTQVEIANILSREFDYEVSGGMLQNQIYQMTLKGQIQRRHYWRGAARVTKSMRQHEIRNVRAPELRWEDPFGAFLGDPPIGRSALDKRPHGPQGEVSPFASIDARLAELIESNAQRETPAEKELPHV